MATGADEAGRVSWTEERLLLLERHEHDFQEFKSSPYAWDPVLNRIRGDFLDNLSKQVSAFANGGGGHLFLGIDDGGQIDGGLPLALRPNGTREWLEDVIPQLVQPALKEFNVYEVPADDPHASQIHPGRAVYVLEIPTSEDAPHQARDKRYYLRIAGKSRPMAHRHILDIMQRSQHPEVLVERIDPYGEPELLTSDPRGPMALLRLRATLRNRGRALAQHVGCEFSLPRFAIGNACRRRTLEALGSAARLQQSPGQVTFFYYHPIPVFPQQSVPLTEVWVGVHGTNLHHYTDGNVSLSWKVYADAASPREGEVQVQVFSAVQRAMRQVSEALRRGV